VARLSPTTAKEIGVADAAPVTVRTGRGEITLPVAVTAEMADGVVWLPTNSPDSHVRSALGADSGDVVRISGGNAQ
jgi:NADH-quinone oxidoreductase subunit G